MRIAVVTDVHANLAALEAVLAHADQRQALDAIWSLGDIVGYGPQPNEVIARLRGYPLVAVMGNHDLAASGGMDTRDFNVDAAAANAWNASQLDDENRAYLHSLPEVLVRETEQAAICHGSLRWPIWEYLFTREAARAQFERMTTPYSFVGHTHVPLVYEEPPGSDAIIEYSPRDGDRLNLGERRLVLNPGGVGQPRDGDPRAAYAILDTSERNVQFFRVPYPVEATQALMAKAGLPPRLIHRLSLGR